MKFTTIAALALFSLPVGGAAQEFTPLDLKLGLWETTTKSEMSGMPMSAMPQIPEETLAKLPPAQRAQIEARMKGMGGPQNMTVRNCITRDSLARGAQFGKADNTCAYKVVSSSSSKQEMHMDCTKGQTKMSGDVTVERVDSDHVKGTMAMKSGDSSTPVNMKMSFDTKWISADCGDVKPAGVK
jgi:hypothetical protein